MVTFADQDSDTVYVTNQPQIVKHAKYCYNHYPTIENNIPQDKRHYDLSLSNYAEIDNSLAAAQLAIGESSNLAQQCLTYTYNYDDQIYSDYVCILSVLAQIAIDNAKRKYDIDINQEISLIKANLANCKYPSFWRQIKKRNDKRYMNSSDKKKNIIITEEEKLKREKKNKKFDEKFDDELICPMNNVVDSIKITRKVSTRHVSMEDLLVTHLESIDYIRNKKIEDFIRNYSYKLNRFFIESQSDEKDTAALYYLEFEKMIKDIKNITAKTKLPDVMIWLLTRAFGIECEYEGKAVSKERRAGKATYNRTVLFKTLYLIDKDIFLNCFREK